MSEHPEGFTPSDDDSENSDDEAANMGESQPVQGQVRHNNISARVPDSVGQGVLSNGVMILTGKFEIVLDFALRMGEQQRIVARCILPRAVAQQFTGALRENMRIYEARFGPLPTVPRPITNESEYSLDEEENPESRPEESSAPNHPENQPAPPPEPPNIQDIYDELKISDEMMSGSYSNAVLIRHSGTEFCLDFITNFFPRSAVSARVFLAAPHVKPLLNSLERSLEPPPGTSQEFA